ncbi:ROK family protein [Marmoricola sp. URHB0036]|uniref:ROK family protein n=1 Tax=Marmoricola sp. URHB0036 TaxID=1298863 RepID=UPI0018C8DC76|nr:ROK family protein [Marmoricola sp. URHB0036]
MSSVPGPATAGEVFSLIRDGRARTRSDVGRLTGLSRTAVAARIASLLESGLVVEGVEEEREPSTGGRPPVGLRFNRDAGVVLAGAIGRSRTQLGVCDLNGGVLATNDLEQEVGAAPDDLMPQVLAGFTDLLKEAGRRVTDVRAVGLSIPGTVELERGASLDSPIMAGWNGVELAPYLEKLTGGRVPVFVDNDANVMALSERRGHLERHRDLLFVKASTGIGVGIVTDGRLLRGALGAAGEIGHNKIAAAQGLPCRCGDTGCLEAVAAGWALVQAARTGGHEITHVRDLVALAVKGDADARHLVRVAGRRIGEVVASTVNVLNPEAVVVGGDLAQAYDPFVAGLRESLYSQASALATRELVIVPVTHGEQSGVVGCAALAIREVLDSAAVDRALLDAD